MAFSDQQVALVRAVRRIESLRGAGIGYEGGGRSMILSEAPIPYSGNLWVVFEEATITQEGLAQLANLMLGSGETTGRSTPRESRWGRELTGAGISCAGMALSAFAVGGGAAAAPVTGGASTVLSVMAWTGLVTSSIQCGIGLGRLGNEVFNPDRNDQLDNDPTYQRVTFGIDILGVFSGVVSAGPALRTFATRVYGRLGSRATVVLAGDAASALETTIQSANRVERSRAVTAVLQDMSEVERTALMREARIGANSLGRDSLSVASAERMVSAIRARQIAITVAEARQLNNAIKEIAQLGGQTGVNFVPQEYVGSASGSLNALFVDGNSQIRKDITWINTNIISLMH